MDRGPRQRVFSKKVGKTREKGSSKPTVSFRSPQDLVEWIKKMEAESYDRTELIVSALRVGRDIANRIGDRWYEIEYRAKKENVSPGEMLAQLALEAIGISVQPPAPPATPRKKA